MRTLKKTLCLVLALVMCLGLCSFASADNSVDNLSKFSDISDVNYPEAADFLIAAGVVDGFKVGNGFQLKPDNTLTRAEAVKLVSYMMLGAEKAEAYKATEHPFTDVKRGHWAEGYIQYAYNEGIIQGRGNGIFDPEGEVTGLEMAAMMLRCVGYDRTAETALKWPVGVQSKAFSLGLFGGGITSAATNTAINRDKTFQMVFNAMTAIATVQYNASVGVYFTGEDFQKDQKFCVGEVSDATDAWWNGPGYKNTLGYKTAYMLPELVNDALCYQMRQWENRRTGQIVTNEYLACDVVATVEARDNANTLARRIEKESDDTTVVCGIWVNGYTDTDDDTPDPAFEITGGAGATTKDAAEIAIQAAKNGFTVKLVDTNSNGLADRIIIVVEYIAQVTDVEEADGPNPAKATITVFTTNEAGNGNNDVEDIELSAEYYSIVNTLEEEDILVVIPYLSDCDVSAPVKNDGGPDNPAEVDPTAAEGADAEHAVISVKNITPTVSAVTSFEGKHNEADANNTQTVTFGGADHNYSTVAPVVADDPFIARNAYQISEKNTYDFYFNEAGYIIGVTEHSVEDTIPNVLYVTAMESRENKNSLFGSTKAFAAKIRAYDVKGNEEVYDLKLETAKRGETADYALTADGLTSDWTAELTNAIAKGDQYLLIKDVVIGEEDAADKKIKLTDMTTWANDWTADEFNPVLAFSKDDDGNVTLKGLPQTANGVTYNGAVVAADDTLKVQKNNAKVEIGSYDDSGERPVWSADTTLFATINTNLVVVDGEGKITTTTGYTNFPGGRDGEDYKVAADYDSLPPDSTEVKAVFYVTTSTLSDPRDIVTDIVVIGSNEQAEPSKVLLAATGDWRETAPKPGELENTIEWQFVDGATGKTVYYEFETVTLDEEEVTQPEEGKVYIGEVGPKGFKADDYAPYGQVAQVNPTWIKLDDGTILYKPEQGNYTAYNLEKPGMPGMTVSIKNSPYLFYAVKDDGKPNSDKDAWTLTGAFITTQDPEAAPPAPPEEGDPEGDG